MFRWTIINIKSRTFVLLMQDLSLYIQLYAKSNFNILYTYMLNVFMLQLCTKNNKIELFKTMDGLEFKQPTPRAVSEKKEASLLGRARQ